MRIEYYYKKNHKINWAKTIRNAFFTMMNCSLCQGASSRHCKLLNFTLNAVRTRAKHLKIEMLRNTNIFLTNTICKERENWKVNISLATILHVRRRIDYLSAFFSRLPLLLFLLHCIRNKWCRFISNCRYSLPFNLRVGKIDNQNLNILWFYFS